MVAAQKGANPRQLTTFTGEDNMPDRFDTGSYPAWSPDGKWIAYWQGGDPKLIEYATDKLAVIPPGGGTPKFLHRHSTATSAMFRGRMTASRCSCRWRTIEPNISRACRWRAASSSTLPGGRNVISAYAQKRGRFALLIANPYSPPEVYAWDGHGQPREVSHQNEWLKDVKLGQVQEIAFKSKDGTDVHGFLVKPPNAPSGRLPTVPANSWRPAIAIRR